MDEDMFSSESPVCPDSFLHADTNLHLVQLTRICWAAEWISFTKKPCEAWHQSKNMPFIFEAWKLINLFRKSLTNLTETLYRIERLLTFWYLFVKINLFQICDARFVDTTVIIQLAGKNFPLAGFSIEYKLWRIKFRIKLLIVLLLCLFWMIDFFLYRYQFYLPT